MTGNDVMVNLVLLIIALISMGVAFFFNRRKIRLLLEIIDQKIEGSVKTSFKFDAIATWFFLLGMAFLVVAILKLIV